MGKRRRREFEFEPSVEGIVKHSLVEVEDGLLCPRQQYSNGRRPAREKVKPGMVGDAITPSPDTSANRDVQVELGR